MIKYLLVFIFSFNFLFSQEKIPGSLNHSSNISLVNKNGGRVVLVPSKIIEKEYSITLPKLPENDNSVLTINKDGSLNSIDLNDLQNKINYLYEKLNNIEKNNFIVNYNIDKKQFIIDINKPFNVCNLIVYQMPNYKIIENIEIRSNSYNLNLENYSSGLYLFSFKIDNLIYSKEILIIK